MMAFATKEFNQGDYVCEHRGVVKEKKQTLLDDPQYSEAGLGHYCLDAIY